jgi:ComF family protein
MSAATRQNKLLSFISYYFSGLSDIIYPDLCRGCGNSLATADNKICLNCLSSLPLTHFHIQPGNELESRLYGRFNYDRIFSYVRFAKGGTVQQLIHNFKYKGEKDIAIFFGEEVGNIIADTKWNSFPPDCIVPVPLHWKRFRERGYNQAHQFAIGITNTSGLEVRPDVLVRNVYQESQTKRDRYGRFENASGVFSLNNTRHLQGKHILLVDDVLTTGSTIEACVDALKEIENITVSVCTIASA